MQLQCVGDRLVVPGLRRQRRHQSRWTYSAIAGAQTPHQPLYQAWPGTRRKPQCIWWDQKLHMQSHPRCKMEFFASDMSGS